MAINWLSKFDYNEPLQTALKDQFGAKWARDSRRWYVTSKAKAAGAEALIGEIKHFEGNRCKGTDPMCDAFDAEHPGFYAAHPLTGETWYYLSPMAWAHFNNVDQKQAKAEWYEIEKRLKAEKAAEAAKAEAAKAEEVKAEEAPAPAVEPAPATEDRLTTEIETKLLMARAIKAVETAQQALDQSKAREALRGVVDLEEIHDAQRIMAKVGREVGRQAREEYEAARAVVRKARNLLASVGLVSAGISELADMSFNRPDRDRPFAVKDSEIFRLSVIETEAED